MTSAQAPADAARQPGTTAPRLRQVCLAVPALAPWREPLQRLFGLGRPYQDPHVAKWGLDNLVWPLGRQFLELVAPVTADAPLHRFLARHPAGAGYIVILNDPALDARRRHLQALDARLVTDLGHDGFHTLQVHPRDAGACMLEFNHTDGGEPWDGPYAPAGAQWQAQVRTDRVAGIAGVVLRGAAPAALAGRWAALTGVAPTADAQGRPRLALDGGFVAFDVAAPGTADGLAELVLVVHDAAAVWRDAAALGLPMQAETASMAAAGLRWQLVTPDGRPAPPRA